MTGHGSRRLARRRSRGDKATIVETGEAVYVRVIGVKGFVTVLNPRSDKATVQHISALAPGHLIDAGMLAQFPRGPYAVHGYNQDHMP